jgi:hypothetical protein
MFAIAFLTSQLSDGRWHRLLFLALDLRLHHEQRSYRHPIPR